MRVDKSVREYSLQDGSLTELSQIGITGNPVSVMVHEGQQSVLVVDSGSSPGYGPSKGHKGRSLGPVTSLVKMSAANTNGWSSFQNVERTGPGEGDINIATWCVMGANKIALFDLETRTIRLYEFSFRASGGNPQLQSTPAPPRTKQGRKRTSNPDKKGKGKKKGKK